jgi:hypothetical protein
MKKIFLYIVISVLISGCKYFEEKRLFSKKVDTLINYAEESTESEEIDSIALQSGTDEIVLEDDITSDSPTGIDNSKYYHSDYKYHIVVGSFLVPEYAERYADKLKTMGYNPEIVLRDDGYHMVAAGSFNELSASISGLQTVKAEISTKAWIYEIK